jgi:hypothetical protein
LWRDLALVIGVNRAIAFLMVLVHGYGALGFSHEKHEHESGEGFVP